jgi:hypothetical protein
MLCTTALTVLLGIEHPLIQAPMGGDDLLDRLWVSGVADPLVARRPAGMEVRQRGW